MMIPADRSGKAHFHATRARRQAGRDRPAAFPSEVSPPEMDILEFRFISNLSPQHYPLPSTERFSTSALSKGRVSARRSRAGLPRTTNRRLFVLIRIASPHKALTLVFRVNKTAAPFCSPYRIFSSRREGRRGGGDGETSILPQQLDFLIVRYCSFSSLSHPGA